VEEAHERLDRLLASPGLRMQLSELHRIEQYRERPQHLPVSVVMPTWNRAFVLSRAVESVLGQSYRNLELIIVDDGSTDDTDRLVTGSFAHDPRVRYLRAPHRGVSAARNTALSQARGSVVAYLDTDNAWREHYLLVMVNALVDSPDHDCAYCAARIRDGILGGDSILFQDYDRERLLERNHIDLNTFVHRASLVERWGGFDERIEGVEDWELVLRFTQDRPPLGVGCALVDYHRDPGYDHLTLRVDLEENCRRVRELHRGEAPVRLAPPRAEAYATAPGATEPAAVVMDAFTCLCTRRSVRKYDAGRPVSEEDLRAILHAGSLAPSGVNAQPWHFYVVTNAELIDRMRAAIRERYEDDRRMWDLTTFFNAPCLIGACVDLERRPYHPGPPDELRSLDDVYANPDFFSLAAAVQNILLASHARGVGSCWCKPNPRYRADLERLLGVEPHHRLMAIVTLGRYRSAPLTPSRKSLDEIVTFLR